MKQHLAFIFGVAFALPALAATQCFYPDGVTVDPNHVPCNKTVTNSACCLPQDSCTANGICLGTTNFNYRGSCTDKTWQSNACPQTCRQDAFNNQRYSTFTKLISCGGPGAVSNEFCCESLGRNCCTIATFGLGSTGNAFGHGQDQLVLDLKNANRSSSQSSSSATTTSAPRDCSTKTPTLLTLATTLGLAVGIPLGVLVLGVLAFLFWREKRRSKKQDGSTSEIVMDTGKRAYFEPGPPPKPPVEIQRSSTWASRTNAMRDLPVIPERPKTGRPIGVRNFV